MNEQQQEFMAKFKYCKKCYTIVCIDKNGDCPICKKSL